MRLSVLYRPVLCCKVGRNPRVNLFRGYRLSGDPSWTIPRRRNDIGRIQRFRDAEADGLFVFRVPGGGKPDVTGENQGVNGAVFRVVGLRKRTDCLLIFKDGDARKWFGLAAHTKPCNENSWSSPAQRFARRPFHKGIGEDQRAVSAEEEIDYEAPQPGFCGELAAPRTLPVLMAQRRDDLIGGFKILGDGVELGQKLVGDWLARLAPSRRGVASFLSGCSKSC